MPLVRTSEGALGPDNRPPWCAVTSAGIFRVAQHGGHFDRHHHDCNEYWLVYKGEALVASEGREFLVKPEMSTTLWKCTPTWRPSGSRT
jgi:mannose-6-phosphate isomerase-like protein (cupin superfamily)